VIQMVSSTRVVSLGVKARPRLGEARGPAAAERDQPRAANATMALREVMIWMGVECADRSGRAVFRGGLDFTRKSVSGVGRN